MSCCEKEVWVWLVWGDAQRDGEVRAERVWDDGGIRDCPLVGCFNFLSWTEALRNPREVS